MRLGDSAKFITFPPVLSGFGRAMLLEDQSLELCMVPIDDFIKNILDETEIPVLCEQYILPPARLITLEENSVHINFDLLGTIFYILTRMEEYQSSVRDEHGRFPASASHAFKNGYLHRPVVDELLEILWHCITLLWPRMERKKTDFRVLPSHDVDVPFIDALTTPRRWLRSLAGDLLKRRNYGRVFSRLANIPAIRRGDFRRDGNYTFDRIMDLSEKHGLRSAFYFKAGCTNPSYDNGYSIDHPYLRGLLRDIHVRGHEIGFHPSYETFRNPEETKREFKKLRSVCDEEGIRQEEWGGRQHYLRWEVPRTWRNWSEAGLNYDSSLSYADCAGFRCGTCHEFPVFDLERQETLPLRERPLIVMEGSLFGAQYMGLEGEEAVKTARTLKQACRKYGGQFTLLWHNSSFETPSMWEWYERVLTE